MSSNTLSDGTIIPHYFQGVNTSQISLGQYDNLPLRFGEVIDIIYPNDLRNQSNTIVYTVAVNQRDNGGMSTTVIYTRCVVSTLFGGVADKHVHTLRKADKTIDTIANGSKVLLACINGETNYGVILGGLYDEQNDIPQINQGHNDFFEFNGLNITIDKDGQYHILMKGATKIDGTPLDGVDINVTGQSISLLKDGSIKLATNSDNQFLFFDNTLKKVILISNKELDITSSGNIIIKSTGVKVGSATDAWMMGSTYRKAQAQLHKTLSQQLTVSVIALNAAAIAIKSLTPTASALAASQAIQQVASSFGIAQSAIDQFESNASKYLSTKNLND